MISDSVLTSDSIKYSSLSSFIDVDFSKRRRLIRKYTESNNGEIIKLMCLSTILSPASKNDDEIFEYIKNSGDYFSLAVAYGCGIHTDLDKNKAFEYLVKADKDKFFYEKIIELKTSPKFEDLLFISDLDYYYSKDICLDDLEELCKMMVKTQDSFKKDLITFTLSKILEYDSDNIEFLKIVASYEKYFNHILISKFYDLAIKYIFNNYSYKNNHEIELLKDYLSRNRDYILCNRYSASSFLENHFYEFINVFQYTSNSNKPYLKKLIELSKEHIISELFNLNVEYKEYVDKYDSTDFTSDEFLIRQKEAVWPDPVAEYNYALSHLKDTSEKSEKLALILLESSFNLGYIPALTKINVLKNDIFLKELEKYCMPDMNDTFYVDYSSIVDEQTCTNKSYMSNYNSLRRAYTTTKLASCARGFITKSDTKLFNNKSKIIKSKHSNIKCPMCRGPMYLIKYNLNNQKVYKCIKCGQIICI